MEGSLEGSHGDRVRLEDGRGHRGGLHHYPGLNFQQRGGNEDLIGAKPRKVVYAIRSKRIGESLTADDLFSFSKVSLVRVFDELEARGIEVRIASIDYLPEE